MRYYLIFLLILSFQILFRCIQKLNKELKTEVLMLHGMITFNGFSTVLKVMQFIVMCAVYLVMGIQKIHLSK